MNERGLQSIATILSLLRPFTKAFGVSRAREEEEEEEREDEKGKRNHSNPSLFSKAFVCTQTCSETSSCLLGSTICHFTLNKVSSNRIVLLPSLHYLRGAVLTNPDCQED